MSKWLYDRQITRPVQIGMVTEKPGQFIVDELGRPGFHAEQDGTTELLGSSEQECAEPFVSGHEDAAQ